MTRSYDVCWDPTVNRAAWAVLKGIVPNGIHPRYVSEWIPVAEKATQGYSLELVNGDTGFGDDANGLGWHLPNRDGAVWLLVPDYRDLSETQTTGWTGSPEVVLDGVATMADAAVVLESLARQLGVAP